MSDPVCSRRCDCPTCTIGSDNFEGDAPGSEGPLSPGTGANNASFGTYAWASPGNVTADDGTNATNAIISTANTTQYLRASNYGFTSIPDAAVVTGIKASVDRSSGLGIAKDSRLRFVKNGVVIGTTEKASTDSWPTVQAVKDYGGSTDPWGESLVGADLKHTDVGVVLAAGSTTAFETVQVDVIKLTAYWGSPLSNWTIVSGSWVKDGSNRVVASGAGILRFNTAHPDGVAGNQNILVKVQPRGSGVVRARGIVAYADANNYLAAEIYADSSGCDLLKLYQVSGGVETQLGDSQALGLTGVAFNADEWLRVCWEPGIASGSTAMPGTLRASYAGFGNMANPTASGQYVGLAVAAGEVWFSSFFFKYMNDVDHQDCPDCKTPCPISSDFFADSAVSACLWSGGSVASDRMTTTGFIKHLVFHPGLLPNMQVNVNLTDWQNGSNATVHIGAVDASNGLTATFAADGSSQTVTLKRSGVTLDTVTINTAPPSGESTLYISLCFDGFSLTATGTSNVSLCSDVAADVVTNGKWAGLSGNAEWAAYQLQKTEHEEDPACTDCDSCVIECDNCLDGTASGLFKLVTSGYTDGLGQGCHPCVDVNGTHIVEYVSACSWSGPAMIECFAGNSPPRQMAFEAIMLDPGQADPSGTDSSATYRLAVWVEGNPGGVPNQIAMVWLYDFGATKPNCLTFDNLELPVLFTGALGDGCTTADPLFVTSI